MFEVDINHRAIIHDMRTVLFFTSRLPFPPDSGRKSSLYHYCKILSDSFGFRVVVVSFLENGDKVSSIPSFIDKVYVIDSPSFAEKLKNIIWFTFIKRCFPMQVSLFWSKKRKRVVDKIIQKEQPILCISDMVRTTEYCKDAPCRKISDLDDMLSIRYMRQLSIESPYVNPYGAYLTSLPRALQNILMAKAIKKRVLSFESKLMKNYEINSSRNYDAIVLVAERETQELNKRIGEKKCFSVPIGIDYGYYSSFSNGDIEGEGNVIAFLGAMSVAHNSHACSFFIEEVLPIVLSEIPDAKFLIVGGGVSDNLRQLESEHVVFTDRVDDVRPYVQQASVFVCPLQFGSGIKTKNLEAMAMGVPIVTTSIGAENIDAQDGCEWIIRDQYDEIANAVIQLLRSEDLRKKYSEAAQAYVKENWTWGAAEHSLNKVLCYLGLDLYK